MIEMPNYRDIGTASKQVATHSAMNPLLWKTVISFPVAAVASIFAPDPLNYFILGAGSLPIVFGCLNFTLFAIRDPDRLQSEKHLENMEIIGGSRMLDQNTGEVIEIRGESVKPNTPMLGGNPSE